MAKEACEKESKGEAGAGLRYNHRQLEVTHSNSEGADGWSSCFKEWVMAGWKAGVLVGELIANEDQVS